MGVEAFLIVGSGVFGASTALYLAEAMPGVQITLVDKGPFPNPTSASVDLNKIVRTDYEDIFYLRLAITAETVWKTKTLYSQFYHPAAHVYLENDGIGASILKHYKALGIHNGARLIRVNELEQRYPGLFNETDYQGAEQVFINPSSGWVEATSALTAVIESAINKGVKYVQADVVKLSFNEYGRCNGVHTGDGQTINSRNTILATGAGTAKLLVHSHHKDVKFEVENRLLAAAVVTGNLKLDESQVERFQHLPIFVHDVGNVQGEAMPLTKEKILKIASEKSFKNTIRDPASGTFVSIPPELPENGQWAVPKDLKDECHKICSDIFGRLADELKFESYRICWDCITADEDFIISGHPSCGGLYFACGGSFHSWKFLPILGECVFKAVMGKLEPELARRWAWDRDMGEGPSDGLWPDREWKDFN